MYSGVEDEVYGPKQRVNEKDYLDGVVGLSCLGTYKTLGKSRNSETRIRQWKLGIGGSVGLTRIEGYVLSSGWRRHERD